MIDIMLDLETMGQTSDSAIVSIGAVSMDTRNLTLPYSFYSVVSLDSSIKSGLKMDSSTVVWWLNQSDEARAIFKEESIHICQALCDFANWIQSFAGKDRVRVWGNGSDFDNVILANAYSVCGLSLPWNFRNSRCYRTLRNEYPQVPYIKQGIAHNSLSDARSQAIHFLEIQKYKNERADQKTVASVPF